MYNRELITFITVTDQGSFLKAAKELYITPASVMNQTLSAFRNQVDCLVAPCDSIEWRTQHNIFFLNKPPCRIAVPKKHHLSKKKPLLT